MDRFVIGLIVFLGGTSRLSAQDSLFIERSGNHLSLAARPFYAVGVNSYFLQNLAAYGDTAHLDEIFRAAQGLGITTIRTWGFFDASDSTSPAAIQYAPGKFNETGLRALDLVVAKAKQYSLRLVMPLVNNWDDYGGMNRYIEWYASQLPSFRREVSEQEQRLIFGIDGRHYRFHVSGSLTHDDFYTNPTVRQWYKNYILMLLNRVNTVTHTAYKDEPAILDWELANEPRSSDPSGGIVASWLTEMSAFVKSIDTNHLVSSGEEGLDISSVGYNPVDSYNGQGWLFDGSSGISYSQDLQISTLDIGSIHCYPGSWRLTPRGGITWLRDHQRMADAAQKPLVIGEVGMEKQAELFFQALFNEAYFENTSGVLPWQLDFANSTYTDAFAFTCGIDTNVCAVIRDYAGQFRQKSSGSILSPQATFLLQNYPNPFNLTTVISYELSSRDIVRVEAYNMLGQRVAVLVDEQQEPGHHATLFDAASLGSGSYFVRLWVGGISQTGKVLLTK